MIEGAEYNSKLMEQTTVLTYDDFGNFQGKSLSKSNPSLARDKKVNSFFSNYEEMVAIVEESKKSDPFYARHRAMVARMKEHERLAEQMKKEREERELQRNLKLEQENNLRSGETPPLGEGFVQLLSTVEGVEREEFKAELVIAAVKGLFNLFK